MIRKPNSSCIPVEY